MYKYSDHMCPCCFRSLFNIFALRILLDFYYILFNSSVFVMAILHTSD